MNREKERSEERQGSKTHSWLSESCLAFSVFCGLIIHSVDTVLPKDKANEHRVMNVEAIIFNIPKSVMQPWSEIKDFPNSLFLIPARTVKWAF